jgi:hypothetical protein
MIMDKKTLQFGKTGYYFIESGQVSWRTISEKISEAGFTQGLFETKDLRSITPEEMCRAISIPFLNPLMVEVIWASK